MRDTEHGARNTEHRFQLRTTLWTSTFSRRGCTLQANILCLCIMLEEYKYKGPIQGLRTPCGQRFAKSKGRPLSVSFESRGIMARIFFFYFNKTRGSVLSHRHGRVLRFCLAFPFDRFRRRLGSIGSRPRLCAFQYLLGAHLSKGSKAQQGRGQESTMQGSPRCEILRIYEHLLSTRSLAYLYMYLEL